MSTPELKVADLAEVIAVLSEARPKPQDIDSALQLLDLAGKEARSPSENSLDRWQSVIATVLASEQGLLKQLLDVEVMRLPARSARQLSEARERVATKYVQRLIRSGHPELPDQVELLNSARTYTEMGTASHALRSIALEARRLLMDPVIGGELALQLGSIDAERRRLTLADLAVDVVTAADYLLSLVERDGHTSGAGFSLELDNTAASSRGDEAAEDLRYRRALDSRSSAVRLGGRLLRALRAESVVAL